MASSEVEIVSSSPFGSVLKDRNRRDRYRQSNARAVTFQKNLRELARDHIQNCISVSAGNNSQRQQQAHGVGEERGNLNNNSNGHDRNLRFLGNNHNKSNGKKSTNDDHWIISSRKSQNLDNWAAKQAREMFSTIEKQRQKAELLAASSSSAPPERKKSRNSPPESKNSPAVGNLGASSLVQIWEARVTQSKSKNTNNNLVSGSSRTSSGCSSNDNVEESPRGSGASECIDEGCDCRPNYNEDSFTDWESHSDRTAQSEPPTFSNFDAGERERVRIADIIKRLANGSDDNDHEIGSNRSDSPSRERTDSPVMHQAEQREQRFFSRVISSPKIRGRQAFADLLMQLERDRHRELDSLAERQAVSKFSQRGRIQSMLRLRFLHRGEAIQDQGRPKSAEFPVNRLSRGTIMHLRKKFSPGVDRGVTTREDASISKSSHTEMASNSSTASQLSEDSQHRKVTTTGRDSTGPTENSLPQVSEDHQKLSSPRTDDTQLQPQISEDHQVTTAERKSMAQTENSVPQMSEDCQKLSSPRADVSQQEAQIREDHQTLASLRIHVAHQEADTDASFLDRQGTAESTTMLNGKRNEIAQDHETNHRQDVHGNSQRVSESTGSLDDQNEIEMVSEQETNDQQPFFLDSQETAETSVSLNKWDENEIEEETYEQDYFVETNYDWISGISRPRSYWEDRRQMWYQEMLSSSSNEEIRQLLERRRVSSFLTSDFRETMDQMLTSRVQRQTEQEAYQQEEEEEEEEEISQERIGRLLLSRLQRHVHLAISQEGEQAEGNQVQQIVEEEEEQEQRERDSEGGNEPEEREDEEEEEEERSEISHQFNEASDFFNQSSASTQMASPWGYQDHEVADDSDPVASILSPQPLQSQAGYQDSRQSSSSTHRLSIETELIYDLRGQIEQLHREMSGLTKIVQSCMEIQMKSNQSNQQEALPVQGMGNNSLDWATKKRKCCICYEMPVDTLLYRCGHMCTCLNCAHELQWGSGKCPICRAPILDVVRAFMHS